MSRLKLFCFGPPRLESDGASINISLRKAQALLTYLAVTQQPHSRDALATLFWPDDDQSKARGNLRRTLSRLKKAVGKDHLAVDRETAAVDPVSNLWLDVERFQHCLAECQTHDHPPDEACADCLPLLTEAINTYTDDFLAGFTLPDCPDFDEWQFFQSESLRQELASALERLIQGLRDQLAYESAIPYARRRLGLDPLHEPAHRKLMELYAQSDQQAAAVRQYQECVRILDEELGVPPSEETKTLYERIRQGPQRHSATIAGQYTCTEQEEDLLGQGSMGHVYRGTDTTTNLPVAVKVLKPDLVTDHPELVERFVREGEALRHLNHPNIVKMLAAAQKDGQHYLVMEYVGGGSLRDLLKQPELLPIPQVVEIGLGLADALTRAHHLNIIHRDLKPGNVLLTEEGIPRLTDFGIARMVDSPTLTQTGAVLGTVDYLSPEACQGESLNTRSDIWAFGVLLYEMLTGERPFSGETIAATLTAILTQPVPDLAGYRPDTSLALVKLISRMLEKDPHQRLPSVRLAGAELEAVLHGRSVEVHKAKGTEEPRSRGAEEKLPQPPSPPAPPHNLPPQPTPFIGRETELSALDDLIAKPDVRLITIVGPGGMGKTRLALASAERQLEIDRFLNGIYFVNLASISSDEFLVSAIIDALNLMIYDATEPKTQLLNYLQNKESLLVLDNFEHVIEEATVLSEMTLAAPGVKLLVTSRERLNLQEEWVYELGGLVFPSAMEQTSEVFKTSEVSYSAMQLFEQRARQAQANFDLAAEYFAAARICQLVNGMPLGLELAAAWLKLMSCQEIAAEIQQSLDFLATSMRNVPARHHSLRAVFRHSWQLLSDEERDVFKKLSVFRGGFTRKAAEQVAGASLLLLSTLVDKSLLRRRENGRYEIHELLRQYAAEKLQEAGEDEAIQERHSDYFTGFLYQREANLKGSKLQEGLTAITADIDNIRAAWQWVIINGNDSAISKSWESLYWYYETLGNFQELETAFRRAVTAVGGEPPVAKEKSRTTEQKLLLGQLLGALGGACFRLGKYREGLALNQQSVSLLRETGPTARPALGLALYFLASTQAAVGAYEAGIRAAQEGLSICTEIGDKFGQGLALMVWGNLLEFQGNYAMARDHYRRCIELITQIGELRMKVVAINGLGRVALTLGLYDEAEQQLKTGYQMRRESGDRFGIALSLPSLGRLALVRGELTHAEQLFEELRHLAQELNHPLTLAYSLAGFGTLARLRGAYEQAEPLLQESLAMQKEQGRKLDIADCLNDLGRLAFDRGDYEQARQLHQESLAIYQELDQKPGLAATLGYLGHVAMAMGRHQYPEARQYFRQALQITLQTEVAPVALDVLRGWATLLMANAPTDAERERAIEILTLVQNHPAGEYETTEKARRLLAEWATVLPPDMMASAQTRGRMLDVWETVRALLDQKTNGREKSLLLPSPPVPPHNLPPQPTPFVGRESELAALDDLIANPNVRLITIVGSGGMGKTRLALAFAERQLEMDRFSNGIYFINLAPLSEADHIIPTIAETLDLPLDTGEQRRTPKQQILDYLRQKQMLVLMDNFEHLLDGIELVADILQAAPQVQILATSRERLQLHQEQVYPIRGLDFSDFETIETAADSDAARLFRQSARRIRPNFEWQANDLPGLSHICRLLEGLPLGLELAAAWVDILSLADIAAEIQRSLDFLESEKRNIPKRHRSMRAVFNTSWQRLSETERDVFAQLSVFRGGFTRQAAQEVTGASLRVLATLANMSLVRYSRSRDRYEIHELLRQYGEEKLQITTDQTSEVSKTSEVSHVSDRHSAYYCAALHQRQTDLKGPKQIKAVAEIDADFENVRTAWAWAVEHGQVDRLAQAMDSLGIFCEWRGRFQEGEAVFRLAAEKLAAEKSNQGLQLLAMVLIWQSIFASNLGRPTQREQRIRQSMTLLDSSELTGQDTRAARAFALRSMSWPYTSHEEAGRQLEQSLGLYRALGDRWRTAEVLEFLGHTTAVSGDHSRAKQLSEESLAIRRLLEDKRGIAGSLRQLAYIVRELGQLEDAERMTRESLALFRELEDRPAVADNLFYLAVGLEWRGKFAEAIPPLEEAAQIYDDLGFRGKLAQMTEELGHVQIFAGEYQQARAQIELAKLIFQELGWQNWLGLAIMDLGMINLAERNFTEARQLLRESGAIFRETDNKIQINHHLVYLAYVERALGNPLKAQQYLAGALPSIIESGTDLPLWEALPVIALLLADRGEIERAVELHALASRNPFIANSRWHEDVAGQQLKAVVASLPPEVVKAAQARGRALDLWETAARLLAELTEGE